MSMKWWTVYSSPNSTKRIGNRKRAGLLSALALSVALTGCSLLPAEPEEEDLSLIELPKISEKPTYDVTTKTIETKVSGSGRLLSMHEKTVYFTLDGKRLKKLYIQPGDLVEIGQPIAELDVEDLKKGLRNQQIAFRRDELAMKETIRNRDEMDPIEYEQAVINFEEAKQRLVDMQEEIDQAILYAPFDGAIVSLPVQEGAQIKAYDAIAIIADPSSLIVAATLNRDDIPKIAVGMEVQVDMNNVGKLTGKVRQLPQATQNSGQGQGTGNNLDQYVLVDVADLPETATRGTPLSISVVVNRKENVTVIPLSTLRTIGARTYVQVVEADGSKREVDVEIGQQTSTDVEILQGLQPGQKVVGR